MQAILSYLQEQGFISAEQFSQLEATATTSAPELERALLDLGFAKQALAEVLAGYYGIEAFVMPEEFSIAHDILDYIPADSATHYRIVPLFVRDDVLYVGINNPDNLQVREALNFISSKHNLPYQFLFALNQDIDKAHTFYENLKGDVSDALGSLESELNSEIAANQEQKEETDTYENIKEDAPVTKIVATILRYAVDGSASDIHIEPKDGKVVVRFRVDGELQTSLELPKNIQLAVTARIKILSAMRLDEKRKPQDGRFSATFDGRKIDFRVSVLPTSHGEKVVMRILDNVKGVRTLEDVGVSDYHLAIIRKAIAQPYGIILISGPTGSGKSTTLYAMLAEVDRQSKNVLSLEDPVEYNIDGVSQSQMRPEIGYTFAHGLRAALRQDPDIIMVGEIRDKETAQLAIQAALTGHLVLSTIHTNNSIGVIPRLIDMGVDPYLIAPTLKLAIAQRLARRLKKGTGIEQPIEHSTQLMIDETFADLPDRFKSVIPKARTIRRPEPTPGCATGMKGRVAIMETLEVTEPIQELILKGASEEEMYTAARQAGFVSMKEDAIIKALDHIIPPKEMNLFGTTFTDEDLIVTENSPPVDNQETTTEDGV